jgi:hypothetical protein
MGASRSLEAALLIPTAVYMEPPPPPPAAVPNSIDVPDLGSDLHKLLTEGALSQPCLPMRIPATGAQVADRSSRPIWGNASGSEQLRGPTTPPSSHSLQFPAIFRAWSLEFPQDSSLPAFLISFSDPPYHSSSRPMRHLLKGIPVGPHWLQIGPAGASRHQLCCCTKLLRAAWFRF